jgi:hypothetical protein
MINSSSRGNQKYIELFSVRRIVLIAVTLSTLFALPVIFFFFTLSNKSAPHPATPAEVGDYFAIAAVSFISFSVAAIFVRIKRAFFAEVVAPFFPVLIGGFVLFCFMIGIYIAAFK